MGETVAIQVAGILIGLLICMELNKIRFGFWTPWDRGRDG